MRLKKVLSLTTALLMTATVAASVLAPVSADEGHSVKLRDLNKDNLLESRLDPAKYGVNGTEVDADGGLKAPLTIDLGVFIYNDEGTGGFNIPITWDIPSENVVEFTCTESDVKSGHAFNDQSEIFGSAALTTGKYTNGVDKNADPENYRESEKAGPALLGANPYLKNKTKANSPIKPKSYKAEETYLYKFSITLATGTKGIYNIQVDPDFFSYSNLDNDPINTVNISDGKFKVVIGEDVPEPLAKPTFTIGNPVGSNADGVYTITDEDRARTFTDENGAIVTSIQKNANTAVQIGNGFAVVRVPVTVTNGLPAIGLQFGIKISGDDANKVVLDSNGRYELDEYGDLEAVNESLVQEAIKFNPSATDATAVEVNGAYGALTVFADNENNAPMPNGIKLFSLQFLVAISGAQRDYSFDVELVNVEWTTVEISKDDDGNDVKISGVAKVDSDGYRVPSISESGNAHFSLSPAKTIQLLDTNIAPPETTTTLAGATTTAPVATTTGSGGGGGGGGSSNPATGDNGVVGVIATVAVLGLAGGAAFLAKKKNDE